MCPKINPSSAPRRRFITWRSYHKWVGVVFALFLLVFCLSGIVLNHRSLFSSCEVNRAWLPSAYQVRAFNQGVIKGTQRIAPNEVVAYGYGGAWLTDTLGRSWRDYNAGLPQGVDRRSIRNLVRTRQGTLWCATNYALYRHNGRQWLAQPLPSGSERLSDLTLTSDSQSVVVLSRSALYTIQNGKAERHVLKTAKNFKPRDTLFRTVWKLHSGELFGLAGRLVVDAIALVLIVLCLTGIVLFLLPYSIRRFRRRGHLEACGKQTRHLKWHLKWHNRLGRTTIVLTLLLTLTGTCLRPPFMLLFVFSKTAPVNFTQNPWNDRLRSLRWDGTTSQWLLHTADGFFYVDSQLSQSPTAFPAEKAAPVSPMGLNVFRQEADGSWLVGSFSGMFRWQPVTGEVVDYFTGQAAQLAFGRAVSAHLVSGYSNDFAHPLVFDYATGLGQNASLDVQPEVFSHLPLSLWNTALELHVGRCYAPLLGPFSELFVFIWGTLSTLVLVSGYVIRQRRRNQQKSKRKL